jgi:hypothetical protein
LPKGTNPFGDVMFIIKVLMRQYVPIGLSIRILGSILVASGCTNRDAKSKRNFHNLRVIIALHSGTLATNLLCIVTVVFAVVGNMIDGHASGCVAAGNPESSSSWFGLRLRLRPLLRSSSSRINVLKLALVTIGAYPPAVEMTHAGRGG